MESTLADVLTIANLALQPNLAPVSLHVTDTALAIVCVPCRLLLFAAASRRILMDVLLPCELSGEGTCVALSPAAGWLAWADAATGLSVSRVPTPRLFAPGEAFPQPSLSVPRLKALQLQWHLDKDGVLQLVSADTRGEVRLWHPEAMAEPDAIEHSGARSLLLHRMDTTVVQLDARGGLLLISTLSRSVLLELPAAAAVQDAALASGGLEERGFRVIGKAKRDGGFGACFLRSGYVLPACVDT